MSAPADGGDAEKKKKKGGKLPRFLGGLALWAGGLLADRLVNKIINGHNARRLEAKNQKLAREWFRAVDSRFESLAMEDDKTSDASAGWSGPQSSAWMDVLMKSLWKDVIADVIERMAPSVVNELLAVYLDARDVVPIPDFITKMELASLKIGDRCPFSIRSVRVAHAPSSRPGEKPVRTASGSLAASRELQSQNSSKAADPSLPDPEDLVLDLDIECLSARLEVIIRSHMRLPLEGHVGELLNKFRRDKRGNATFNVHITEMRFEGVIRVRIRPRARIVMLGFQEAPTIKLGMQGVFKSKLGFEQRVPMTALPGVVDLFQLLAKAEIEEYATWPRFLAFDMCPPLILGLKTYPTPPRGRLVVTLLEARGLPPTAAPPGALPYARYRWGLIYRKKGAPAPAPIKYDAAGQNGYVSFAGGGEGEGDTFEGTMLLSIEMLTVTICVPGAGAVGSCQVKLFLMGTGETVFYFNSGWSDSYTALPTFLVAEEAHRLGPHWAGKLAGRLQQVQVTGELGVMDAWVPMDGIPGAAVRLRIQADWPIDRSMPPGPMPERSLSVQEPGVPVSIADAAKAAEVQRAHEEVTEVLTIMEVHGVDPTKRWRCVVRLQGQHEVAWKKTHARRGEVLDADRGVTSGPRWNQTFELRHSIEPATIVLVRVGSPMSAKKEVEVAFVSVPRLGLTVGKCSAFWVDMTVLEGKDVADALGLVAGGAGWDDEDDGTPSARSEEAKVEGIKSAFAQASAGIKRAFSSGGLARKASGKSPVKDESKSGSRRAAGGGDADAGGAPKLLLRVGFVPKRQLEFVPHHHS